MSAEEGGITLPFIMAFIGVAIMMMIGIFIYGAVDKAMPCPTYNMTDTNSDPSIGEQCEKTKSMSWTVIGILPVLMFFVIFGMMGGMGGGTPSWLRGLIPHMPHRTGQANPYPLWIRLMVALRLASVREKDE